MSTRFLPGPCTWNGNEIIEVDNPRVGIAGIASGVPDSWGILFAAAPEMLEALEVMVSKARKQNWNDNYPEELEMAVNAVKKALGQ